VPFSCQTLLGENFGKGGGPGSFLPTVCYTWGMARAKFSSGAKVRVVVAPKEAPQLAGKVGEVVYPAQIRYGSDGLCCVRIGENFTHFRESALEQVKG